MPTLPSSNCFITNLKISHSTCISLKFIVKTQLFISVSAFADPKRQEVLSVVDLEIRIANCLLNLLNFQIKPYDFNHCKPSKKSQPSFCPFFSTWKVFTALKQRGIGVDNTPHTCFALSYFFPVLSLILTGASWTGEEIPGESYPAHHNPFGSALLHFQVLQVNT